MNLDSLKKEVINTRQTVDVKNLSTDSLKEIQRVLASTDYYQGKIDGIYGKKTQEAIAKFKEDAYLAHPELIGPSTVEKLIDLADKAATHSDHINNTVPTINHKAGTHTGRTMVFPGGVRVHANELIKPGIPLTWGEVTKNLTRIPESVWVIKNIHDVTEEFGRVRNTWGGPLRITSGYRPPHLKIGAPRSQHKVGLALDVQTLRRRDLYRLWQVMVRSDFVGLGRGMKKGFIHCDLRRTGQRRVVFNY